MQEAFARFVDDRLQHVRPLLDQAVLVGGAAVGLLLDDPGAAPARPTNDIDLIVAVDSRMRYEPVAAQLRALDIWEDSTSGVICRWRHRPSGTIFDVMPTSRVPFGFGNVWYAPAFEASIELTLPSGLVVRCASAPYLLAMKFVAWEDRGGGDAIASHDMNDIIALVDGVSTIVEDVASADEQVRTWLATQVRALIDDGHRDDAILGYLFSDAASQARRQDIVDRLDSLAGNPT